MLRTWIVVIVVAGVAVAAIVDGVRGGHAAAQKQEQVNKVGGAEELAGPDVPPAGGLPGTLVLARGDDCRLQTIAFAGPQASKEGVATACGVWASPDGSYAVVVTSRWRSAPILRLSLTRLANPAKLLRALGQAQSEPTWSPDSRTVAWCDIDGSTSILTVDSGHVDRYPGCYPRYTPDGHLLLIPARDPHDELWRDSEVFLSADDLARGLPGADAAQIRVLDYDARRDGTLAVSVMQTGASGNVAALELWRERTLLGSFLLPSGAGPNGERIGQLVRFSPDGQELAIGPRGPIGHDPVTFFDLRLRKVSLQLAAQSGFAWSPDGGWLAVGNGKEVAFYSRNGGDAIYRLPVTVGALDWVASDGTTG